MATPDLDRFLSRGREPEAPYHLLTVEFGQCLSEADWRAAIDRVRQLPHVRQLRAEYVDPGWEPLLRAIVVAWDSDDEAAFELALRDARQHLGLTETGES